MVDGLKRGTEIERLWVVVSRLFLPHITCPSLGLAVQSLTCLWDHQPLFIVPPLLQVSEPLASPLNRLDTGSITGGISVSCCNDFSWLWNVLQEKEKTKKQKKQKHRTLQEESRRKCHQKRGGFFYKPISQPFLIHNSVLQVVFIRHHVYDIGGKRI